MMSVSAPPLLILQPLLISHHHNKINKGKKKQPSLHIRIYRFQVMTLCYSERVAKLLWRFDSCLGQLCGGAADLLISCQIGVKISRVMSPGGTWIMHVSYLGQIEFEFGLYHSAVINLIMCWLDRWACMNDNYHPWQPSHIRPLLDWCQLSLPALVQQWTHASWAFTFFLALVYRPMSIIIFELIFLMYM